MEIDTELMAALREEAQGYGQGLIDATDPLTDAARQRLMALPDVEQTVNGYFDSAETTEWFSLPRLRLPELIKKYIDHIELSPTADVCKCTWLIHPDDVELPPVKQRKKKSIEHPRCMVHTKLGFLLGFFAFTFPEGSADADTP